MVMRQPGTRSQERTFSAASIIRLVLLMFRSVYYDRTAQLQLARPRSHFPGPFHPRWVPTGEAQECRDQTGSVGA